MCESLARKGDLMDHSSEVSEKKRAPSGGRGRPGVEGADSFSSMPGPTVPPEALHTVFEVGRMCSLFGCFCLRS